CARRYYYGSNYPYYALDYW
nr:immunoglobulin heavy chain junction region [Mus musculus]MBK4189582.1 immunoglobulin heavy chain junction region [Mus musculus]MBK4189589.1 immunoglobulin heavy chain junction region [Mus musculus]